MAQSAAMSFGKDVAGGHRRPHTGEGQDHVARVRIQVGHEVRDDVEHRPIEVRPRNAIEDLGWWRSEQGAAASPHDREQDGEVGTWGGPGRQLAALELAPKPIAVLEVEERRVAPGFDL